MSNADTTQPLHSHSANPAPLHISVSHFGDCPPVLPPPKWNSHLRGRVLSQSLSSEMKWICLVIKPLNKAASRSVASPSKPNTSQKVSGKKDLLNVANVGTQQKCFCYLDSRDKPRSLMHRHSFTRLHSCTRRYDAQVVFSFYS